MSRDRPRHPEAERRVDPGGSDPPRIVGFRRD